MDIIFFEECFSAMTGALRIAGMSFSKMTHSYLTRGAKVPLGIPTERGGAWCNG